MKTMECPHCGAMLTIDENKEYGVCEYCGSKVNFEEDRSTNCIVDEVESEKAEHKNNKQKKNIGTIVAALFVLYVLIRVFIFDDFLLPIMLMALAVIFGPIALILITRLHNRPERRIIENMEEGIEYPLGAVGDFKHMTYREVENELRKSGFTNVTCVGSHSFFNSDYVNEILVDGKYVWILGNRIFPADVPILVRY